MANVFDLTGKAIREIKLPDVFSTQYRPDLIQRVVLAIQSHRRQPYGTDPLAGHRTSAHYHGVKDTWHSMKNKEMARGRRTHESSPGQEMRGRFSPHTVGGRRAHPPKAEKIWDQKINRKENFLAIKSALAAVCNFDLVSKRHKISKMDLPIIITDDIQNVKKTKDLEKIIEALNISSDVERAGVKKVRPGKGKMRGRKYKRKKSILFVISENKGILDAAKNISGVDICVAKNINVELLAPGTQAGRLTVFDESAIKKLGEIYG